MILVFENIKLTWDCDSNRPLWQEPETEKYALVFMWHKQTTLNWHVILAAKNFK